MSQEMKANANSQADSGRHMSETLDVSVGGKRTALPALTVCGVTVVSRGRFPRIGEIFDEYWLERDQLPDIELVIAELKNRKVKLDIFTFSQRVPETTPKHGFYSELDNYAVLPVSTHKEWLERQIPATTRRNIRASEKRGITVRVSAYDDDYVEGIMSIYNETPIRAGRRFWHFGKSFETTKAENGTYRERSTYLSAYRGDEMVGYLKIVWDAHTAAIMQILSKLSVRDCRPNNALLSEAVNQCAMRNVNHLLYEKFDYGNKVGDSLTRFKQSNGFCRMDVPRYYVPLTSMGVLALRLGIHKRLAERAPEWLAAPFRNLRTKWHERHAKATQDGAQS